MNFRVFTVVALMVASHASAADDAAADEQHNFGKGWHIQLAASASPFVVYGSKTDELYAALSVLPEIRVKRDFGNMAFGFSSLAWGVLSAITKSSSIESISPTRAQTLSSQPISFLAGVGLDVARTNRKSTQSVSLGFDGVYIALGYSNFKIGEVNIDGVSAPVYDRGFAVFLGVSVTALSINVPDSM